MTERSADPQTTNLLVDLLKQAAAAHGVYEKAELNGVYDADWPDWYARHMALALDERGYRIVAAPERAP